MVVLTEKRTLKTNVIGVQDVTCVMCGRRPAAGSITAGSLRADGSQAFACTIHLLRDRRRWIVFWAMFDTEQRYAHKRQGAAQ